MLPASWTFDMLENEIESLNELNMPQGMLWQEFKELRYHQFLEKESQTH